VTTSIIYSIKHLFGLSLRIFYFVSSFTLPLYDLLTKVVRIPTETGGYSQFQLFKECRVDKAVGKKY